MRHPDGILCPVAVAGVPGVPRLRAARIVGPRGADPCQVCRWQTARNNPHPAAQHKAGQVVGCSVQARASEVRCTPSDGLSFPLQPQRYGARASGEKTADPMPNVGALVGVSRYGVAVDVAIHAPHREGDQRNHHAHVLTSTRRLESGGFTTKTRVLDSAKTGGVEIEQMRGLWAELQNRALERAGEAERVDHRSLEAQREAAQERGDTLSAEELDRDPELKLGPAANSMERRAKAMAERQGREYVPVTERGAVVHAARQARAAFREMRERLDIARETYGAERDAGQGRVSAGLAALRAAAAKERGERAGEDMRERLARVTGRLDRDDTPRPDGRNYVRERLKEITEKDAGRDGQAAVHKLDGHSDPELGEKTGREDRKPSVNERLKDVLNKPREKLEIEDTRDQEKDQEVENEREIDREIDRDPGLSH